MIADFWTSFPPLYFFCLFGPEALVFGASEYWFFNTQASLENIPIRPNAQKNSADIGPEIAKNDQIWALFWFCD